MLALNLNLNHNPAIQTNYQPQLRQMLFSIVKASYILEGIYSVSSVEI